MLKAELLEIIDNGENSGVEFKRDNIRPEQLAEFMPVSRTTIENLDLEKLSFYLKFIIKDPDVPEPGDTKEWTERLLGLGFMSKDSLGNKACTIAGLICFGFNPRRFLRQSGIRVISFQGTESSYKAELDTVVAEPMVARYRMIKGRRELVGEGIIEKLSSTLSPFISEESDVIDENMRREKQRHYPWEAIREAVVNALVHRDWTRSTDVEICNFSNRIEIKSPGKLHNSMTIEKIKAGQRSPRNPAIVEIMKDFNYTDARGMGVRTKLIPFMLNHNGREPVFEATEDYLKVTLFRKDAR